MLTQLELIRRERGITQKRLAEQTGYHASMISKYERGFAGRVSERFKERIGNALGVSQDQLFAQKEGESR